MEKVTCTTPLYKIGCSHSLSGIQIIFTSFVVVFLLFLEHELYPPDFVGLQMYIKKFGLRKESEVDYIKIYEVGIYIDFTDMLY